ncbi:MAG: hypothetical protein O3C40_02585 [Planctomycetota bacterium]|nr:hypothetical protein [Planctomycetota bacterium]
MKPVPCCAVVACVLFMATAAVADEKWTFEDAAVGKLPQGWSRAQTGRGEGSVWKIQHDESAPAGPNVLAQVSDAGPNPLFNLCVLDEENYGDVDITVSLKAVAGKIDQGGGPVWRYQDANNYYVCRHNPLEDNFRIYKVIDGKRTQLASADAKAPAGTWHTIKVTMRKDKIVCSINGDKLDARDDTITAAGKVGLWTKADAVTNFDDFHVQPADK